MLYYKRKLLSYSHWDSTVGHLEILVILGQPLVILFLGPTRMYSCGTPPGNLFLLGHISVLLRHPGVILVIGHPGVILLVEHPGVILLLGHT